MSVLVVGGGGREHALVWKMRQSPRVERVCCAPGQRRHRRAAPSCVPIDGRRRRRRWSRFAREQAHRPDRRRARAAADARASSTRCASAGLRVFGPTRGRGAARGQQGVHQGAAAPRTRSRPAFFAQLRPIADDGAAATCARSARRSSSRPTGSRRARASSSARRSPRPSEAIDEIMRGRTLRRRRRARRRRGVPRRRGGCRSWRSPTATHGAAARLVAGPQARLRRRHAARTPAAWAPTRRRRSCTPALHERIMQEIMEPGRARRCAERRASSTAACSTPG